MFFVVLTTWRRGRTLLARRVREDRVPLRRFLNRLIEEQPQRVAGTAVILSSTPDMVPAALLNNVEHNHIVHRQVVLLSVQTAGVPHVPDDQRVQLERLRLGFVQLVAQVGYQDTPDVPAILRLAEAQGLEFDPAETTFYVNHVTLIPGGDAPMAGWRTRLFALLYQNSAPAARYFNLPSDRVFEVGAYVQI